MNSPPVVRFLRFAFSIAFGLLTVRAAAETQVPQQPLGLAAVNLVIDPLMAEWVGKHKGPGAVVVVGAPDAPGVPLLAGRSLRDGVATAYVCRGFVCDRPVTTVPDLAAQLGG